ncbi:hypothetical protein AVEN_108635-1 [Araneus ventricosus]|uniref:Secreted protein n=1 Tax=Araneus ventricosus TaxID=182803 RepID=A0A4Y2WUF7_ARAVE|nr:hypothetical protein AVEN_108635-1 [Araneus ventricosus]
MAGSRFLLGIVIVVQVSLRPDVAYLLQEGGWELTLCLMGANLSIQESCMSARSSIVRIFAFREGSGICNALFNPQTQARQSKISHSGREAGMGQLASLGRG